MADPYSVLGVRRSASDAEVRTAYRRLVKLHHPDHKQGSADAARRFEQVQEAYAEIQRLRAAPPPPPIDPDIEARLAALEHQVLQARRARDRAEQAAREAARAAREAAETVRAAADHDDGDRRRATDEELGYVTTDDTIGKILADARSELSDRAGKLRQHPVAKRVSELIEGLEELTEKLDRPRKRQR